MITSSEYTTSEGLIIAGNKCLNDVVVVIITGGIAHLKVHVSGSSVTFKIYR